MEIDRKFEDLVGKTLVRIEVDRLEFENGDEIVFLTECGKKYRLFHDQDVNEQVDIDDICGNLGDLLGSPILVAEEVSNSSGTPKNDDVSYTWTFYKIDTARGGVTIRWYGCSNGCYSEAVDFVEIVDDDTTRH